MVGIHLSNTNSGTRQGLAKNECAKKWLAIFTVITFVLSLLLAVAALVYTNIELKNQMISTNNINKLTVLTTCKLSEPSSKRKNKSCQNHYPSGRIKAVRTIIQAVRTISQNNHASCQNNHASKRIIQASCNSLIT